MLENIVIFLIDVPPIEEIGGPIEHIIEQYRAGILEKKDCIKTILSNHKSFIQKYSENDVDIQRRLQ